MGTRVTRVVSGRCLGVLAGRSARSGTASRRPAVGCSAGDARPPVRRRVTTPEPPVAQPTATPSPTADPRHARRPHAAPTGPADARPPASLLGAATTARGCASCSRGCASSPGSSATSPTTTAHDHRGGEGLPGQARARSDRARRPAHPATAARDDRKPTADELANRFPGDVHTGAARRPLPHRPRALRRQDEQHRAVGRRRPGPADDGGAVRGVVQPDPRGPVPRRLEVARPRLQLYGSAMPYAMFFSGGQAVHYSSDFAARGYAGASHGCVNVRDHAGIRGSSTRSTSATRSSSTGADRTGSGGWPAATAYARRVTSRRADAPPGRLVARTVEVAPASLPRP